MKYSEYADANAAFMQEISDLRELRTRALVRINPVIGRNNLRIRIHSFFNNADFKTLYLFESVVHQKCLRSYRPEVLRQRAQSLSLSSSIAEPVYSFRLPERFQRRARIVVRFGPQRHAAQRMVADVLKRLHPPRADQFTINGGVPAALRAVEEAVREGYVHGVERDIVHFYDSVRADGLYEALRPIPREVVENVVLYRGGVRPLSGRLRRTSAASLTNNPAPPPSRGPFLTGAASSPIAAEIIVAGLIEQLPENIRCVAYADNVLLLGRTRDVVETASSRLEVLARECSCGPLELRANKEIDLSGDVRAFFEFLGYEGEVSSDHHHISWKPRQRAWENCLEVIGGLIKDGRTPRNVIKWLDGWRRGYPMWETGQRDSEAMKIAVLTNALFATRRPQDREVYLSHILAGTYMMRKTEGFEAALNQFLPNPTGEERPDYSERQDRLWRDRFEFLRTIQEFIALTAVQQQAIVARETCVSD